MVLDLESGYQDTESLGLSNPRWAISPGKKRGNWGAGAEGAAL